MLHRLIITILALFSCVFAHAQTGRVSDDQPRNLKIVSEQKDKDGNIIRIIEYDQGGRHRTEKEIIKPKVYVHVPVDPDTLNKDSLMVVVNKSRYELQVFYRRKIIRSYKAVFGPRPLENKKMSGDRCTPEGWFRIKNKNPNSKYHKFMLLDYPNDSSVVQFNNLKAKGTIPQSAKIGGDVGIHGIWKGGDDMIEMGVCWTDGCVAVKNKDIDDLYSIIGVGTRVYIRK